jgi:hypothetical protein
MSVRWETTKSVEVTLTMSTVSTPSRASNFRDIVPAQILALEIEIAVKEDVGSRRPGRSRCENRRHGNFETAYRFLFSGRKTRL